MAERDAADAGSSAFPFGQGIGARLSVSRRLRDLGVRPRGPEVAAPEN